ncbi:glutathione S-transferase family protein [Hyphococcus sp. DH-69]|uniref:glutathione S-transferase family protein n=1 Tax=Hyphococcus formosus TaxID=3143534 RepID=UPI00398AFC88
MSKPVLYHAPNSRSQTPQWLNEELGGVCDVKLMNLAAQEQKAPEFLKLNPMGKIPVLIHEGVVVTEAAAICVYLADRFPEAGLAPKLDDPRRGTYLRWIFFAPSSIEPLILDKLVPAERANPDALLYGSEETALNSIRHALSNGDYILGDQFSAADVVFGSTLNFAMMFGAIEKEKLFTDYVGRLTARPAAQKCAEANQKFSKELGLDS